MNKKQKKVLFRILLAAVLIAAIEISGIKGTWKLILYLAPYLIIGYDILIKAAKGIRNLQPFDENFLMSVATVGAFLLGEYTEAAAVMLFYQIGELFQSYAVGKSRRNISALMDIRPDYANIEQADGSLEQVDPDEVEIGTVITVKPGEKITIDGIITEGTTSQDTAALTGESVPREAAVGSEVLSGSINLSGLIRIRTTREFGESTASKILDLVENASSRKSRSENFITKFARIYTPAVCISALALALVPPVIRLLLGMSGDWSVWVYRALTFLVISCPCALVVSIPLTFFAGLGGAGREGILIKGSNYMETLSQVRHVVFDKTGTMTKGVFEVNDLHHSSLDREKLLFFAAHAESASSHPIAQSIIRAYGKSIDETIVADVEEIGGNGIKATVDGHLVAAGNSRLMEKLGISCIDCHSIGTIVHIAIDNEYCGHLVISDTVKESAHEAVRSLKAAGVRRTVMLTGDLKRIGEEIANRLDIDEVYSELLPHEKVEAVERLLSEKENEKDIVAFVGDGINDAPVLGRADIGIAMGALGSDAAIEASDIVLMDDDPLKISKAIRISKKCMRIVYENIWFAIGVKLVCLMLGALGIANMWIAIFADVGVMIIAVLNAIRALFVKRL